MKSLYNVLKDGEVIATVERNGLYQAFGYIDEELGSGSTSRFEVWCLLDIPVLLFDSNDYE